MSDKDILMKMFKHAFPAVDILREHHATETVVTKTVNGKKVSEVTDSTQASIELIIHGMDSYGYTFFFDDNGTLAYIQSLRNL